MLMKNGTYNNQHLLLFAPFEEQDCAGATLILHGSEIKDSVESFMNVEISSWIAGITSTDAQQCRLEAETVENALLIGPAFFVLEIDRLEIEDDLLSDLGAVRLRKATIGDLMYFIG